jgi:hypothetical protein
MLIHIPVINTFVYMWKIGVDLIYLSDVAVSVCYYIYSEVELWC